MQIKGIKDIRYERKSVDVFLDVGFEPEIVQQWELIEPEAQVVYTLQKEIEMDYMELLDQGMIVHSFEFSEEDVKNITNYLEKSHIEDKIRKSQKQKKNL